MFKNSSWKRPNAALPLGILLLGIGLSVATSNWQYDNTKRQANIDFLRYSERIADEIVRRLRQPIYGLRGAAGLYAANQRMDRASFSAYVASRDLPEEFPGVRGLGFIQRVEGASREAFVADARADGAPGFAIRQLKDTSQTDLYVIKYIEPPELNRGALGLDVGSETVRRKAAEMAMLTGKPILSGAISLVQDAKHTPGFLLYVPLYRAGARPSTPEQRQKDLVGLLYTPIVANEMLNGVAHGQSDLVHFELVDMPDASAGGSAEKTVVFASNPDDLSGKEEVARFGEFSSDAPATSLRDDSVYQSTRSLEIVGRTFQLNAHSSLAFEAMVPLGVSRAILILGVLLSGLLAAMVHQLQSRRRQAEDAAKGMTGDLARLALVAQRTSNVVIITDRALRITWVNEGFTRLYGHSAEQALGRTPGELLGHPETPEATLKTLRDAAQAGVGCRVEVVNQTREGRKLYVATEVQPTLDAQGELIGFVEIANDITASKREERALALERQALANVIEGTGAGTWECHLETRDLIINDRWAAIVGHSLSELENIDLSGWTERIHPDDIDGVRDLLKRHLSGSTPVLSFEARMRHKHGGWVWAMVRGKVVARRADGKPLLVAGTLIDVSQRKLAESEAERNAALLRGAIDTIDEAFVLYDPDDRLVFCNEKYRQIYANVAHLMVPGARFEDLIRLGVEMGQYSEAVGRVDEWVAERVAAHLSGNTTLIQKHENGRALRIVERKMPDGHIVGFRIDITEMVRATEAAQAASTAKSQFLANMSHEIRTPMNAVLGLLKLLRKTPLDARQADYAAKTENAAQSLLGLLNDILDFSKIEAGKATLEFRPFDLDSVASQVEVIALGNLGDKPVDMRLDIDSDMPRMVVGDAMRIQQVLTNLVGNAVKFTAKGEVVLSMKAVERNAATVTVEIAVSDTGIGIDPEKQKAIFSGFTQAEASTTRRFGGTGLGLAISQRFVALMGSELLLDSALGEGSRFHFCLTLPVASEMGVVPAGDDALATRETTGAVKAKASLANRIHPPLDSALQLDPRRLNGLRLLVVEDNLNNQQVARELLEGEGASVQVAHNGQEAVDTLAAARPQFDAVLMDVQMPVMDGYAATAHIRKVLELHALPIIAITANTMLSDREASLAAGMNDHVGKPFDLDHLVDVVRLHTQGQGSAPMPPYHANPRAAPLKWSDGVQEAARAGDIQLDSAVKRLGSDVSLYREMLRKILGDLLGTSDNLHACAESADRAGIGRLLHTAKGLAATVGSERLAAEMARLEAPVLSAGAKASSHGAVDPVCASASEQARASLAEHCQKLEALLTALDGSLDGVPANAGETAPENLKTRPPNTVEVREGLCRLAGLLRQSDMSAVDALTVLPRIDEEGWLERMHALERHIAALEFEPALGECERLLEALQS